MILAVEDRYGSDIDVKARLMDDGSVEKKSGTISLLSSESAYYKGGALDNDGLKENDIYVVSCNDRAAKMIEERDQWVEEAVNNRPSEKEVSHLKKSVDDYI